MDAPALDVGIGESERVNAPLSFNVVRSDQSRFNGRTADGDAGEPGIPLPVVPEEVRSGDPVCTGPARPLRWLRPLYFPVVVLCTFAVLFVGWEVIQRYFLSSISIGMRHFRKNFSFFSSYMNRLTDASRNITNS